MKLKCKIKGKEVTIELQAMNGLDYYDIQTSFRMGQIKFSEYAAAVIKECVATPTTAREIKFFEDSPSLLDKIVFQCGKISNAGLLKEEEIEIIEE
ncbi:MAG: hypothetical protein ACRCUS_08205 [Anaerovoracaceae bacterium]